MASTKCAGAGLVCRMVVILGTLMTLTISADPDLLQDFCVADLNSAVKVNGYPCKSSKAPMANDFYYGGLANPAKPAANSSSVTTANVQNIPGLNTLGVSMARIDYSPQGIIPPHIHPRGSEIVFVLNGVLEVGFITTDNVLVSKTIKTGDVFVFPEGLLHYQRNTGNTAASAIAAFSSQLPGTQLTSALFAAKPAVPDAILAYAFKIDTKVVQSIKTKFALKK